MTENQITYLQYFVLYFGNPQTDVEEIETTTTDQTGWY